MSVGGRLRWLDQHTGTGQGRSRPNQGMARGPAPHIGFEKAAEKDTERLSVRLVIGHELRKKHDLGPAQVEAQIVANMWRRKTRNRSLGMAYFFRQTE